jgi:hypothetical protein
MKGSPIVKFEPNFIEITLKVIFLFNLITSNARLRTRLALSRRNSISEL